MKILATLLISLISTISFAQTGTVNLEVGFRYNLPEQLWNNELSKFDEQRNGYGFNIMPKWNFSAQKSIGLNLGFDLISEDARTDDIGTFDIVSVLPTYKHLIFSSKFSPFYSIGLGGYFVLNSETLVAPGLSLSLGTTLFRKGILSFEYNKILSGIKVNEDIINGFDSWYFVGIKFNYLIEIK